MTSQILIVDDEDTLRRNVSRFLTRFGFVVTSVSSGREAIQKLRELPVEVALLDYRLSDTDGVALMAELRAIDPELKVILMTGHGGVEVAVSAMKAGAVDYLSKPFSLEELKLRLDELVSRGRLEANLRYYRDRARSEASTHGMVGESLAVKELLSQLARLSRGEAHLSAEQAPPAVLLQGETGTGKELVARALHFNGPRAEREFVDVNCAAIPEQLVESELFGHERGAFTDAKAKKVGLAEAADGGTLFLDEVGDLPMSIQAKLLRLLEARTVRRVGAVHDRQVNVRVIAATNCDLEAMVDEKTFRADLYFRLGIVRLKMPPLRDRGDDVIILAERFVDEFGHRYGKHGRLTLGPSARAAMSKYSWPGNVRELRNVMEQAVLMTETETISDEHLAFARIASPAAALNSADALTLPKEGLVLSDVEKLLIEQALQRTGNNTSRAAQLLGLTRDTLRYRMEKHGL
ncbi:MAG: sigma-54 dependent transcriptional regulator [Gammaproteobacteria bacterium]|nr:sigma-54 dependent transcriptional regulator [Gammaproteobacteria bacterium]